MTADPFKTKKFNEDVYDQYQQSYSSLPINLSSQSLNSTNAANKQSRELNQESINNQAFVQAHYDANKELAAQLKANIDLLFKGSK